VQLKGKNISPIAFVYVLYRFWRRSLSSDIILAKEFALYLEAKNFIWFL
jgi:hypothetical protein